MGCGFQFHCVDRSTVGQRDTGTKSQTHNSTITQTRWGPQHHIHYVRPVGETQLGLHSTSCLLWLRLIIQSERVLETLFFSVYYCNSCRLMPMLKILRLRASKKPSRTDRHTDGSTKHGHYHIERDNETYTVSRPKGPILRCRAKHIHLATV